MVIIKKLPVTNHFATGPQRAEICIYDVKFVRGKLTKDIRSYAARYLELQCIEGVAPRTCGA